MSGIFGIADSRQNTSLPTWLDAMGKSITHRPWYQVETHHEDQVALGRVGIGIFNRQHQPLHNTDKTIWVFFTGELSDLPPQKHSSDPCAEFILERYQQEGLSFISRLHGAFILMIWDRTLQKLFIINDRAGLYPMVYAHHRGRFVFAPEMKGIFCDPEFPKQLDPVALAEYMRFQLLLGDKTFFTGLHLLPNACCLCYDLQEDTLTLQSYWDFSHITALPASQISFDEAVEETARCLQAAVRRCTEGPYRLGVYLSGGMDARVILGLIEPNIFPITTITYGLKNSRDVCYAQKIAQALPKVNHHYFEFLDGRWVEEQAKFHFALTEGFHSWIHAHGISVLPQVRELIDVNLTGLMGGEINWDDPVIYHAPDEIAFNNRLFDLLTQKTTWPSLTEGEARSLFDARSNINELAYASLQDELKSTQSWSNQQRVAHFSLQTTRRLFQYYVVTNRSHIEQRFPFYDDAYLAFVHSLPPEMLFNRQLRRAVICKITPDLARIPYDKDNLPISAKGFSRMLHQGVQRAKTKFSRLGSKNGQALTTLYADYEGWLRGELRTWGEDLFFGNTITHRETFNPEALHSLWARFQNGVEPNFIGKIAPIMTYAMLLEYFGV
jgi:asparagine synthase (glutamine-hydrolysing)